MKRFETQVVRRDAGEDLSESEGCFVTLGEAGLQLAGPGSQAAEIYGCLLDVDVLGRPCDVALPGYHGIVDVLVAEDVADGQALTLAEGGAVKPAGDGDLVVAVALSAAAAGEMADARLVQPAAGAGAATVAAPPAEASVAKVAASASKKTTTK